MQRPFDAEIYGAGYRRHFQPDDVAHPFHALYEQKRKTVLACFSGSERLRIVDVGGGYGRIAGRLAEQHEVTLCDISSEMLDEAAERYPRLERVQADARRLPFADGRFDAAIAIDLLPHVGELEHALRELARVVRTGGTLVFDTSNATPWWVLAYPAYFDKRPWRLVQTLRGGGVLPEWQAIVRHHRRDEVERAAAAVGLEVTLLRGFGPRWTAKWHLWRAIKR